MPSDPTRLTPTIIGSSLSAMAGVAIGAAVALAVIGNLQVTGDLNVTGTMSGATVKIGGGTTTISATSCYNTTTTAAQTISGATLRTTAGSTTVTDAAGVKTNILSGALLYTPGTASCIFCRTAAGKLGCVTRTATGTIATGTCT